MERASVIAMTLALACVLGCSPESRQPARAATSAATSASCEEGERFEQWLPDDEDARPASPGVTYVKMSDWTPPPQVQEVEARVAPRGDAPPVYTTYPKLTLDREIGSSRRGHRPLLP